MFGLTGIHELVILMLVIAVLSATGEIVLESNVAVCGKMTAGRWVRTV